MWCWTCTNIWVVSHFSVLMVTRKQLDKLQTGYNLGQNVMKKLMHAVSPILKKNSSLKHSWLYRPFPFPPKKQCWSPARPFFFLGGGGGGGSVGWKERLLCWKIGSMGILWVGKCQNFNTFCLHCSLFPSDLKSPSTAFRLCTFFYQYFWEAYHTLASPQTPFGVRSSRIHFYPRDIC